MNERTNKVKQQQRKEGKKKERGQVDKFTSKGTLK